MGLSQVTVPVRACVWIFFALGYGTVITKSVRHRFANLSNKRNQFQIYAYSKTLPGTIVPTLPTSILSNPPAGSPPPPRPRGCCCGCGDLPPGDLELARNSLGLMPDDDDEDNSCCLLAPSKKFSLICDASFRASAVMLRSVRSLAALIRLLGPRGSEI